MIIVGVGGALVTCVITLFTLYRNQNQTINQLTEKVAKFEGEVAGNKKAMAQVTDSIIRELRIMMELHQNQSSTAKNPTGYRTNPTT